MKALIQRVTESSVTIDGEVVASIGPGLLVLLGVEKHDDTDTVGNMVKRVLAYRVFSDADGRMNLSVLDVAGGVLVVSQFTLAADTKKGLRPGFSAAAPPERAKQLYEQFVEQVREAGVMVGTGQFGADMKVQLVNDGPVTFLLEL